MADQIVAALERAATGQDGAHDQLITLVYEELRIMAHRQLASERGGVTLSTTALVNEAYLRLVGSSNSYYKNQSYFFGAAARAMRRVIVDIARSKLAEKRGNGQQPVTLCVEELGSFDRAKELVDLDLAMESLKSIDERLCTVVECRFFCGFTEDQTSEVLGVTSRTVRRDWQKAKAWLKLELMGGDPMSGISFA